jgi:hypothetical protein
MRRSTSLAALLAALLFCTHRPTDTAPARRGPDIVIIDTGSEAAFRGTLNLARTCRECWHKHGTWMAITLEDQLNMLNALPVQATMTVYKNTKDIIDGVRGAIGLAPRVISMSLAGTEYEQREYDAIKEAVDHNILVVAAAGNSGLAHPEYPAGYKLPCVVAVSSTKGGHIAQWAHRASVGEIYLEAMPGEDGTSYSTQRAAAYALVYFQEHPLDTCKQAKAYLVERFGSVQTPLKSGNERSQRL